MHELSLAMDIVRIIEQHADLRPPETIGRIFIEIGSLACVEPDALRTSFEAASRETAGENATLVIVSKPGRVQCRACDNVFEVTEFGVPCPSCGSFNGSVESGRAIRVTELEVN